MLLLARCERLATKNRTVSGDTFSTLSSLDNVQMEQQVNFKFLVKLGKTFTEAYAMLKEVYGNECLSRTQVFEYLNGLKRDVKRSKTIRAPGGPQHQKRKKTLRKLVKLAPKETRFESVEAVKAKATEVLNQLTEANFQHLRVEIAKGSTLKIAEK
ncbi:hypothetical protein NQ318_015913 [Aromia moschata]|uniref:Uncharacterized protein n=1 Tax=Aromia moschata TaxID=1265417 RepID=A0AAV8Y7T8_9CUCU|nr:hypothetical protein NQ318_015913 [Aromia moschata]